MSIRYLYYTLVSIAELVPGLPRRSAMRLLLAITILLSIGTNPAFATKSGIFHSTETMYGNMKSFSKWNNMITRHKGDKQRASKSCDKGGSNCPIAKWKSFLNSLKNKSRKNQITAVQKYINEAEYIIDPINWGVEDYWASPKQFFIKDGDCEDYAIAKFISLRELGIKNSQMRVVILNDTNLKTLHSVLTVSLGGEILVLDNQISQVVPDSKIHHYKPIYSINETNWWLHRL